MWLMVVYVGLIIAGDILDYVIGLGVERMWGTQVSLIVFLALYFIFLWLSWLLAVRLTKPSEPVATTPAA